MLKPIGKCCDIFESDVGQQLWQEFRIDSRNPFFLLFALISCHIILLPSSWKQFRSPPYFFRRARTWDSSNKQLPRFEQFINRTTAQRAFFIEELLILFLILFDIISPTKIETHHVTPARAARIARPYVER